MQVRDKIIHAMWYGMCILVYIRICMSIYIYMYNHFYVFIMQPQEYL